MWRDPGAGAGGPWALFPSSCPRGHPAGLASSQHGVRRSLPVPSVPPGEGCALAGFDEEARPARRPPPEGQPVHHRLASLGPFGCRPRGRGSDVGRDHVCQLKVGLPRPFEARGLVGLWPSRQSPALCSASRKRWAPVTCGAVRRGCWLHGSQAAVRGPHREAHTRLTHSTLPSPPALARGLQVSLSLPQTLVLSSGLGNPSSRAGAPDGHRQKGEGQREPGGRWGRCPGDRR